MEKSYFDKPTQVIFADPDNSGEWITGIAYKNEIICGCYGGIFDIDEIIEIASENNVNKAIYEYENWISLSDEIIGGEVPNGLTFANGRIVENVEVDFISDEEISEFEAQFLNLF